jgi:RHS repeat-associated protein
MRRPIEERDLEADNTLILGFTYTYDRVGNKLTEGKLHDAADSETYTYDSADRLLTFNRPMGSIAPLQTSWTLDGVGNFTTVNGQPRQYSSTNALISVTSGSTTTSLFYDNNGNQTSDGTYLYSYDFENRLRTVTLGGSTATVAVYSYDALGRRIQKVVTNSPGLNGTTLFYYDGTQDIEEHNATNTLTQQYVYGNGGELLVLDRNLNGDGTATGPGDQRLLYVQNAIGSVYGLTSTSGTLVEAYQYDAYGHPTVFGTDSNGMVNFNAAHIVASGVSQVANPFLFTGLRYDPETGLYFVEARYLNPIQGRFIQQDPLGLDGGTPNLYIYAADRPTFATDPTGQFYVYGSATGRGITPAFRVPGGVRFPNFYAYNSATGFGPAGPFFNPGLFNPIIPFAYFAVFNPIFGIFGYYAALARFLFFFG